MELSKFQPLLFNLGRSAAPPELLTYCSREILHSRHHDIAGGNFEAINSHRQHAGHVFLMSKLKSVVNMMSISDLIDTSEKSLELLLQSLLMATN